MTPQRIAFFAEGIPKGQPRPRAYFNPRTHRAGVYTDRSAEVWKGVVAASSLLHRPLSPLEGPIGVMLTFRLPRPKSLCRKKDPVGPIYCGSKPDVDNLAKAVLDVLTQLGFWRDDSQVASCAIYKFYVAKPELKNPKITLPGVSVSIRQLGETTEATPCP